MTDLLEVSDEKLSQLEPSPLKNLLKQFENNTVNSIWSGLEKKIEIQDYRNYCQKNIPKIQTYLKSQITFIENAKKKYMLSNIFDELFSDFEKLDDRTCIAFENKLGYSELTLKVLIEQSKFCLCFHRIKKKIHPKVLSHFQKNQKFDQLLEDQLDKSPEKKSIDEISTPLIKMLNLCVYLPEEKVSDFLVEILQKENNRNEKTICRDLIESYPSFNQKLKSMDKFNQVILLEDYQVIRIFLYHEQCIEKSAYLEEIYQGFFQYCHECSSLSRNQFNSWSFSMKLITQAHQDSSNPDENNLDHALFQLIFLHSLLENDSLFGEINEENIEFAHWLFEMLSKYEFITNIENINIKKEHLDKLKSFSSIIDESNRDSEDNLFFKQSMKKIYEEIKLIYIQKSIQIFLKENSNVKWLEVVI